MENGCSIISVARETPGDAWLLSAEFVYIGKIQLFVITCHSDIHNVPSAIISGCLFFIPCAMCPHRAIHAFRFSVVA